MRLGDVRSLAFELEPISPSWKRKTPSDRGPWAKLEIWVAEKNLCEHCLPAKRTFHSGVYVPLAPICDWLVRNARMIAFEESARAYPTDVDLPAALAEWKDAAPAASFNEDSWDDQRYAWSERHFLAAGADGAWLPNLAFVKVDADLWISSAAARFATPDAPRFLNQLATQKVAWQDALSALSEFVDFVGEALRGAGLAEDFPWSREAGAFARELEINVVEYLDLGLGIDLPKSKKLFGSRSEAALRQKLGLSAAEGPEESATLQALRDLDAIDPLLISILLECDNSTRAPLNGHPFREQRLRALEAAPEHRPEDQGYSAARLLREDLGLGHAPLKEPEELLHDLGIEAEEKLFYNAKHDHAIAEWHLDGHGKVVLLGSPQVEKPWARRMELLRGAGHLLLDAWAGQQAVGAASSIRAVGPRRRRSGAFAAEMLLPQAAVRERSGGVLDAAASPAIFQSLMADYGVGAQTAAWQCWNAGLLSSREVVEELISTYGSPRQPPLPSQS